MFRPTTGPVTAPVWGSPWAKPWMASADPALRAGGIYLANATNGLLLPGFAYTRSGPDLWCPQADGSLASFAANVIPREWANGRWGFRFDPVWSQYITRTHDFSHATWTKRRATVVPVSIATPDGIGSAFKLVEDTTAANSHYLESEFVNIAATRGCFIVKAAEVTEIGIRYIRDTGVSFGGANARVDLLTGAVTLGTLNVEPLSGGWWKVTGIPDGSATTNVSIRLSLVRGGSETYTGDGASGVYVLAANATSTTYPAPITVATGSPVTVPDFSCNAQLSALGITLESAFSVVADFAPANLIAQFGHVWNIGRTSTSYVALNHLDASSKTGARSLVNGSSSVVGVDYPSSTERQRVAMRISSSGCKLGVNGALSAEDLTVSIDPALDRFSIGRNAYGSNVVAMSLTALAIVPNRALTDAELQALTA